MKIFKLLSILFIAFPLFSQKDIQETTETLKKSKEKKLPENIGKKWEVGGTNSALFNQVTLKNWAAGGQNSITIAAGSNLYLNFLKDRMKWSNSLDMNYAIQRVGDQKVFQKNDDRINFLSKFGYKAIEKVYYMALLNFRTQFTPTFQEGQLVSHFLAPAWLEVGLGAEYTPVKELTIFFAPVAGKFTFVNNQALADAGAYGVQAAYVDSVTGKLIPGKTFRHEIGAMLNAVYNKEVMKNITYKSILGLFNNYSDPNKPNRKNIDISWQNWINMKVNKYITVSFSLFLLYDHDIDIALDRDGDGIKESTGKRTQINQTLGVGFVYKFPEKKK